MTLPLLLSIVSQFSMPTDLAGRYDPASVARLNTAYQALRPVRTATIGGGTPLGFRELLTSIRTHHPNIRAADARTRGARGEQLAADGGFDPKLGVAGQLTPTGFYDVTAVDAKVAQPTPLWGTEFFAGYRYGRADDLASYDERETLDQGEVNGGVKIPVLRSGAFDERRAALRTSRLAVESAQANRGSTELELVVGGAEAYWSWVAAGEGYLVVRRLVRLAEVRTEQVDAQVEAGAAPEIYRAENLRSLLKRREKLVRAERKLDKATIKLSLFQRADDGMPERPDWTRLPARVPESPLVSDDELPRGMKRALAGRPELAGLEADLRSAMVDSDLADVELLPQLDFEFKFSQDFGTDSDDKTQESLEPFEIKALMVVEFPLLLRKGRGKAVKARAKVEETGEKLRFTQDKIRVQVQDLWSLLQANIRRSEVSLQLAEAAEIVAAGERERMVLGATSPFVVNLREQDAADARLTEIDARAARQVAWTAWQWLTLSETVSEIPTE